MGYMQLNLNLNLSVFTTVAASDYNIFFFLGGGEVQTTVCTACWPGSRIAQGCVPRLAVRLAGSNLLLLVQRRSSLIGPFWLLGQRRSSVIGPFLAAGTKKEFCNRSVLAAGTRRHFELFVAGRSSTVLETQSVKCLDFFKLFIIIAVRLPFAVL